MFIARQCGTLTDWSMDIFPLPSMGSDSRRVSVRLQPPCQSCAAEGRSMGVFPCLPGDTWHGGPQVAVGFLTFSF